MAKCVECSEEVALNCQDEDCQEQDNHGHCTNGHKVDLPGVEGE
ncbi:MAG TPA: hypothetical protein VNA68_00620 [Candidatus Dormibacteraeota bacterium]|nr:hypothetical protein [Candidatus Dormibacteraeota bacterium]